VSHPDPALTALRASLDTPTPARSDTPDPNPPSALISRMRRTTVTLHEHPEVYSTRSLSQMLATALELSEHLNRALKARGAL
jgi:hypothetical protein